MKNHYFALLLTLFSIGISVAQSGTLDTSFDLDGKKVISFATPNDYGEFVLIQPDSKIIVGGRSSLTGGNLSFSLARLNPSGTFDNSFGTSGKVTTSYGTEGFEAVSGALQSDGKIVVVGNAFTNSSLGYSQIAVVRYNSDGSLDTTLDTDGMTFTQVQNSNEDFAKSVKIQPDGKIVVGTQSKINSNGEFVLIRYNSDGSLDSSFGVNGIAISTLSSGNDYIYDIDLQSDGKIVEAGYMGGTSNDDLAVVRYNSDGSVDTSFANNGLFTYDFASAHNYVFGVAVSSDAKIILVGRYQNGATTSPFVARLSSNGTFDTSFDTDGILIQTTDEQPRDVLLQSDNKIIVAGTSNLKFGVWKLNVDGTFDSTFGTNGKVETLVTSVYSLGNQAAIQPDGKLVVVGSTFGNPFMKYGVIRYHNDAPLGLDEMSLTSVVIHPNPIEDFFTISSSEIITKIEIVNLLGQTIFSNSYNQLNVSIDAAKFETGTYILKVSTNEKVQQSKIIKK